MSAGTPRRRSSASVSWSTVVSVTRSGCRWRIRKSPSMPPAAALSAISASETVNGPRPSRPRCRAGLAAPGRWGCRGHPAGAGEELGDLRVGPAQPPGDPRTHGEQLRRVGDAGAGAVDQLPQRFSTSSEAVREQLFLAVEVVIERPEADVGLLGDLRDARPVPAALGDQPHRGAIRACRVRALRRSSRDTLGAPAADTASAITPPPAATKHLGGHAGWS